MILGSKIEITSFLKIILKQKLTFSKSLRLDLTLKGPLNASHTKHPSPHISVELFKIKRHRYIILIKYNHVFDYMYVMSMFKDLCIVVAMSINNFFLFLFV